MSQPEATERREEKSLKAQRAQIKAKMTRFRNFLNSFDNQNSDHKKLSALRDRLNDFLPLLSDFDNVQSEIEFITEDFESSDQERGEIEIAFYDAVALAKSFLESSNPPAQASSLTVTHEQTNIIPLPETNSTNDVQLPTIRLPEFKGSYEHWIEFRDSFIAMVHENKRLSSTQKFYYLRSSLQNEARELIRDIPISNDNYEIAWDLLCDRYEDKLLIIHSHLESILNLQSMNKESFASISLIRDTLTRHLRPLKVMGLPVDSWDILIIHIIAKKFDPSTRKDWESYQYQGELPTMKDLETFLKTKAKVLEKLVHAKGDKQTGNSVLIPKPKPFEAKPNNKRHFPVSYSTSVSFGKCKLCDGDHTIHECKQFLDLSTNDRIKRARELRLCLNCLRPTHSVNRCYSRASCKTCHKRHNTLLHLHTNNLEGNLANNSADAPIREPIACETSQSNHTVAVSSSDSQILLSTARLLIQDSQGNYHECRALLDSGSQSNFISKNLCEQLKLAKISCNLPITGINQAPISIHHKVNVRLTSRNRHFSASLSCLILPNLTKPLPTLPVDVSSLNIPENIVLADPAFNKPGMIDLILGADQFWNLICVGQVKLGVGKPILQKSRFGWLISGNISNASAPHTSICHLSVLSDSAENNLTRFWQLENTQNSADPIELDPCEIHFIKTVKRDSDGRFIVSVPYNEHLNQLGQSRNSALKRLYSLERRLQKDECLKGEYTAFIEEYKLLGHMTKTDESESPRDNCYYLPHHSVIRETSTTTKLRVVFDGSAKTDSNLSLNDVQHVGPNIQSDLMSILIRFRQHRYVMTADIMKMYRQILVSPEQRRYQRILWRSDENTSVECYELNTVTYGTASAPFLAVRCLHQLAKEIEHTDKFTSRIIKNDFYVDDLLTGADTGVDLLNIYTKINKILSSGCFTLRKWSTNNPELLHQLKFTNETKFDSLTFGDKEEIRTLGISWNANSDKLSYVTSLRQNSTPVTKRTILSQVGQIYDPLGLLGPVIVTAKLFIQRLWSGKFSWDESLPMDLHSEWLQFKGQLYLLNDISIDRNIICKDPINIELHGFSDASERAYGACIYVRSLRSDRTYYVKLLCAKSRVAPLHTITLPRLELCAAVLLANLMVKTRNSLTKNIDKCYYWCDSSITLHWIRAPASKWKTFVAHRVAEIQTITNIHDWKHIRSEHNPADIISRGLQPNDLLNSKTWFTGPSWLSFNSSQWPVNIMPTIQNDDVLEQRNVTVAFSSTTDIFDLYERYSSLSKLQRISALCLRFANNCRNPNHKIVGPLRVTELNNAIERLIKRAQNETFSEEINSLKILKTLNSRSNILSLNPFTDPSGILRVGGRIQNSNFSYDKKHQILLHPKHRLTHLIVRNEHLRLMHCGPQALLASIRQRYWPMSGKNLAKKIVRDCITCFKANPRSSNQLMGNLPKPRVNLIYPFHSVGVDYAGPILIKDRKTRGYKLIKAYICLFVCMATKAMHLELTTDLTTENFIATLRRLVARRGKPSEIYSDNGTSFVGANSELKELARFLKATENQNAIVNFASNENIIWHFIPPNSPNFGGLWEAGVKSVKAHLRRILRNSNLTFEELYTVLTQIESILNSRPLCPLSSDPNDLEAITPAHFLIGRTFTTVPDPDVTFLQINKLSRYQYIQRLNQHFWQRWSKEYVPLLQNRTKWKVNNTAAIKLNQLALIQENNLPPTKWALGRIVELHPGKDGKTRVISLKTQKGEVKRSANKICVLPEENIHV